MSECYCPEARSISYPRAGVKRQLWTTYHRFWELNSDTLQESCSNHGAFSPALSFTCLSFLLFSRFVFQNAHSCSLETVLRKHGNYSVLEQYWNKGRALLTSYYELRLTHKVTQSILTDETVGVGVCHFFCLWIRTLLFTECRRRKSLPPGWTEGWGSNHAHQWRASSWTCPHGSHRASAEGTVLLCPGHVEAVGNPKE